MASDLEADDGTMVDTEAGVEKSGDIAVVPDALLAEEALTERVGGATEVSDSETIVASSGEDGAATGTSDAGTTSDSSDAATEKEIRD